jgi:CubicO group peptidase (beta-lactamase class C family)
MLPVIRLMQPTRRAILTGGSSALVAPLLYDVALADDTIIGWRDRPLAEYAKLHDAATNGGYRLISLSIYGSTSAPSYAAVMIKRPSPAEQRLWPNLTSAQLAQTLAAQSAQGFGAVIIAATGSASDPRFALLCEQQDPMSLALFGLQSGRADDPATIQGKHREARIQGLIPRWIASYGTASAPCFAAVWVRNSDGTAWNGDGVADTDKDLQARIDAQTTGWRRPALLAVDQDSRHASVFVDSRIGSWQAQHGLTSAQYQQAFDAWTAKGYVPVCVQAAGASVNAARFAALFVQREEAIERKFTATGPTQNAAIDDVIAKYMKAQPLRQASIAIVKGTKLVYARGYTYAEPDWPVTQPTTLFRLASVSKTVTALALFQLVEENKLKLTDTLQSILQLKTPAGGTPKDPRFASITVQHLLEHTSGVNPGAFNNDIAVLDAHRSGKPGQTWNLPVTAAMVDAYIASLAMATAPGTAQVYNNCGHYLLGRVVAKVRNAATPIAAMQQYLFAPLKITRIRAARTLVANQPQDEARYGPTIVGSGPDARLDIPVLRSVMSNDRPLVPPGYGEEQYENKEGSGGLSAATTDLARLLAVWIDPNDTAVLKRATVKTMLDSAIATAKTFKTRAGYGLDGAAARANGLYYGQKGGDLVTSQNVLQFNGDLGFIANWAGRLIAPTTGTWYPNFPELMNIASKVNWGTTDLFPNFGMTSL